ncbi:DUF1643 domain-containing protein [Rhizorhabdus sp.]|uniref:DUF1643 domain-containing protein n=1 Tax=Rhizorhabdus sp. TaxID=1968843 RepID=UPI0025DF12C4|nr:DUF1643 domain-containing protein [Rhizorhabdus sp.]
MKLLSRTDLSGMECRALFSECEAYRYTLTWRWARDPLLIAWMLNPSTATHEALDNTVSGLIKRARVWGLGGVRVINLFAFRATEPADMKRAKDPVGPENDRCTLEILREAKADGDRVVCAWGAHGKHKGRDKAALGLAAGVGIQLHAFQINDDGSPKHPLYIAHEVEPQLWRMAA